MNTQCGICGLQVLPNGYIGDVIGGICQGHTYPLYPIISRPIVISTDSTIPPCPLTNSSHEKALVRVVEKRVERWSDANDKGMRVRRSDEMADFIQALCLCGHIISEAEIKSK